MVEQSTTTAGRGAAGHQAVRAEQRADQVLGRADGDEDDVGAGQVGGAVDDLGSGRASGAALAFVRL